MEANEIRRMSLEYAKGNAPKVSHWRSDRKRTTKIRKAKRVVYAVYIQSAAWKRFRERAIRSRGGHCEKCPATHPLEVHHLTYERLGRERLSDVQVLCEFHHSLVDEKHMRKSGYAFLAAD